MGQAQERKETLQMKQWTHVFVILVIVVCALIAGMVATTHARANVLPPTTTVNCQVAFSDGPNQGKTEPVTFEVRVNDWMEALSNDYVGGVSESGSWIQGANNVTFTFSSQLAVVPGGTLKVNITFPPFGTNPMVGPGVGTITDSNGTVLVVTHTTTTCPAFSPPACGLTCTFAVPPGEANPRMVQVA